MRSVDSLSVELDWLIVLSGVLTEDAGGLRGERQGDDRRGVCVRRIVHRERVLVWTHDVVDVVSVVGGRASGDLVGAWDSPLRVELSNAFRQWEADGCEPVLVSGGVPVLPAETRPFWSFPYACPEPVLVK